MGGESSGDGMARGRQQGTKNRNYPPLPLGEAMKVARAIQDQASGMTVSRLTLANLLHSTPTSRVFKDLVAASRFYGLTNGGINADDFSLTKLGEQATGADEVAQVAAMKAAVMNVPPYKTFFESFKNKKLLSPGPFKEFLVRDALVPAERAEEAASYIVADAETAGLTREVGGSPWIDLDGTPTPREDDATGESDPPNGSEVGDQADEDPPDDSGSDGGPVPGRRAGA